MAKHWYILRVQSNRENRARENLLKRKAEAEKVISEKIGEVMVPTERVTEIKSGKRRITTRRRYPGYVMLEIEEPLSADAITPEMSEEEQASLVRDLENVQQAWALVRETPCVGDFVGGVDRPVPMKDEEVRKMLNDESATEAAPKLDIRFSKGDGVKITHGPFESFEGTVDNVDTDKGRVKVIVTIFGRQTPLELEYWEVEPS